jgi:hypothetical protein
LLDIKAKEDVSKEFEKYAKSTTASRDDKAKFNEGIYEMLEYSYKNKETGEINNTSAECERKTGYKKLRAKLAGSRKNNTPFKYL